MSDPILRPFTLTDKLMCPHCGMDINNAASVTPGSQNKVHKGLIIVCSACGAPSIVGDSSLEALTEVRFKELDPRTQQAIRITANKLKQIASGQN